MPNAMSEVSSRAVNAPESELKKNVEKIDYATGQSVLGTVLVARSRDGVCAILIGSDDDVLKADLAARFPGRMGGSDDTRISDDLARVVRAIAAPREGLDLPLDMQGTPFQRRVWAALRAIPPGVTVTYTELARRLGAPGAVRAASEVPAKQRGG